MSFLDKLKTMFSGKKVEDSDNSTAPVSAESAAPVSEPTVEAQPEVVQSEPEVPSSSM